jgi:hypothetical protein
MHKPVLSARRPADPAGPGWPVSPFTGESSGRIACWRQAKPPSREWSMRRQSSPAPSDRRPEHRYLHDGKRNPDPCRPPAENAAGTAAWVRSYTSTIRDTSRISGIQDPAAGNSSDADRAARQTEMVYLRQQGIAALIRAGRFGRARIMAQ